MAFIQMNLIPETLVRPVPVNVILPVDKLARPGTGIIRILNSCDGLRLNLYPVATLQRKRRTPHTESR